MDHICTDLEISVFVDVGGIHTQFYLYSAEGFTMSFQDMEP